MKFKWSSHITTRESTESSPNCGIHFLLCVGDMIYDDESFAGTNYTHSIHTFRWWICNPIPYFCFSISIYLCTCDVLQAHARASFFCVFGASCLVYICVVVRLRGVVEQERGRSVGRLGARDDCRLSPLSQSSYIIWIYAIRLNEMSKQWRGRLSLSHIIACTPLTKKRPRLHNK